MELAEEAVQEVSHVTASSTHLSLFQVPNQAEGVTMVIVR